MPLRICLRLEGVDFRASDAYAAFEGDDFADVGFEAKGAISFAVFYSDSAQPSLDALDLARRINKVDGVCVSGVYDELLSTRQIADRSGVTAESVRLWARGERRYKTRAFPAVREVVELGSGQKSLSLYAWSEVVPWMREVVRLDPEEGIAFLSSTQLADLNAEISDLDTALIHTRGDWAGWTSLDRDPAPRQELERSAAVTVRIPLGQTDFRSWQLVSRLRAAR